MILIEKFNLSISILIGKFVFHMDNYICLFGSTTTNDTFN